MKTKTYTRGCYRCKRFFVLQSSRRPGARLLCPDCRADKAPYYVFLRWID